MNLKRCSLCIAIPALFVATGGWVQAQPPLLPAVQAEANGKVYKLEAHTSLHVPLRLGEKKAATLLIQGRDGKTLELLLRSQDASATLPDAVIHIALKAPNGEMLFRDNYYVRPNPVSYKGDEKAALIARWGMLPPASTHELDVRIETETGGVALWVDDRFVGRSELSFPATLQLKTGEGSVAGEIRSQSAIATDQRFVPIGLRGYSQPDSPDIATVPWKRGAGQIVGNVPFEVAEVGSVLDVGRSRWLGEKVGPEEMADTQYSRNSFDRRPDNILLAVPTDDYSRAHVLAVVDPDPGKTPVLTLSLTRYTNDGGDSGGRGDAQADSTIRLERKDGQWPAGVRQLGTVKVKNASGKEVVMPLVQFAVPIKSGEIPDVIDETGFKWGRSTQYLDLELTKELHLIRTRNHGSLSYKPVGKPSGVQIYGLTLERAPVKVRLRPRQVGNVFYVNEKTGFDLEMQNRIGKAFSGKLLWTITDFYGKVTRGESAIELPDKTESSLVALELPNLKPGWRQVQLTLVDGQGNVVWQQPTTLAALAVDTRKAGLESPYGTWWFRTSHGGTDSLSEIAPLYQRMGFRHTSPSGDRKPSGAELAKFGLSLSMIPYIGGGKEDSLAKLDAFIAENPIVKSAMIFHESNYGAEMAFPPEFIGKDAPVLNEKQRQNFDKMLVNAKAYGRHLRETHPDIKIIVGNGGLPFIAGLMQNGFPKELVDAWGDEETGQALIPEAPPTSSQGSLYWLEEYNKKYGYNKEITAAYEWRARGTNPGNLSELEQAQYFTRDVLRALSHGAASINPGIIHDVGDAYYFSRWGSGGFTRRYPLLNPKISYVALAVFTQELDQAKFQRVLDTDSPTLHAMEFRQGNDYVYALWVPRGEKKVHVTFAGDSSVKTTDMNGSAQALSVVNRQGDVVVSDSPLYLRSTFPIASLQSGATHFTGPLPVPVVADSLSDLTRWQIESEVDATLEKAHFDVPRQPGNISARSVLDEEKQNVLELTLAPQPTVPWPVARYATLRPKAAVPLAGTPESVGVWVKGNSSWGRVFFEIEDARGEKFYSIGAEDDGWNLGDWKETRAINFDGWNYLSAKLPRHYSSGFYEPQQSDWRSRNGDGIVDYPIKVSRLTVEMRDKIVQLNRPVDVPNRSIRLSGLSGF